MSGEDINHALSELHAQEAARAAEAERAQRRFSMLQAQMPAVVRALRAAGVPSVILDVGAAPPPDGRWRRRLTRRRREQGPGWLIRADMSAIEWGRIALTESGELLVGNPAIPTQSLDANRAADVAAAFARFLSGHGIEQITVRP